MGGGGGLAQTSMEWVNKHIKGASVWSQRSATVTYQKPMPLDKQLAPGLQCKERQGGRGGGGQRTSSEWVDRHV